MLSVIALTLLMAACVNAADGGARHDHGYDWLNPGGSHSYTWWTPAYYDYTWYPAYTYTYYPTYYYTTPVVYSTYYYDPVVYNYDPWWAANVYGLGGVTYYYGSWSWSSFHGGFF